MRDAFDIKLLTDIKLRQRQLPKIIQSGELFVKTLGNISGKLSKKDLLDLAIPLAKDVLPNLATKASLSVLDEFGRKINWWGAVRAEKELTIFISNKDMDDIIKAQSH